MRNGLHSAVLLALAALGLGCAQLAPKKDVAAGKPAPPPQGAVVLFDGKDTSAWEGGGGKPFPWMILEDGSMEVVPKTGGISTKQKLKDFRLHLEFWLPKLPPEVKSQGRANSGVFMQGRFEVQVLDSYNNPTYPMGGCAAIYKKRDPDHFDKAVRPPETWNTYDITFRAARFEADGKKTENARMTVVWNGVVVHDNVEVVGPTIGKDEPSTPGPINLQDHGNKVRYRNIWVVPMP